MHDRAGRHRTGRLRWRKQWRGRYERRDGHGPDGDRAGLPRSAGGVHDPGSGAQLDQLHASGHVQARERAGRQRAHSGSRHRPAADLAGPEDLHPDPSQGPRVLERPARQGERLQVHGRAHDQGQLGRQELRHRQRRGRNGLRRGQGERHLGHHDRRCHGQDHHPARGSLRRVLERAGVPRARPGSVRHAGSRPSPRTRCPRASGRT